jgi:hypothetical protein
MLGLVGQLARPRTYRALYDFGTTRKWEWDLAMRDTFYKRQGLFYHLGQTAKPQYLIGGIIFMFVAGIDIIASLGTEMVLENPLEKAEKFKQVLQEKRDKMAENQEKMDVVRTTTEAARAGKFAQ